MRDIKFRCWDNKTNQWVKGFGIDPDGKVELHTGGSRNNPRVDHRDFVLMQSTNLKDKNGVEIYEGDIVKFKVAGTKPSLWGGDNKGAVHYNDQWGGFTLLNKQQITMNYGRNFYATELEVIGNIYENGDLLK